MTLTADEQRNMGTVLRVLSDRGGQMLPSDFKKDGHDELFGEPGHWTKAAPTNMLINMQIAMDRVVDADYADWANEAGVKSLRLTEAGRELVGGAS